MEITLANNSSNMYIRQNSPNKATQTVSETSNSIIITQKGKDGSMQTFADDNTIFSDFRDSNKMLDMAKTLAEKSALNNLKTNQDNNFTSVSDGDNQVAIGGNGDDTVSTWHGDNQYASGGSGDDNVTTGWGDNQIADGGSGDDYVSAYWGNNQYASGGSGDDRVATSRGDNQIADGGTGDDFVSTFWGDNQVAIGGSGDDIVSTFLGNNQVASGGSGNDQITVGGGNNIVALGGSGDDIIKSSGSSNAYLDGGSGDDLIEGHGLIVGGTGNDFINIDNSTVNTPMIPTTPNTVLYNRGDGHDILKTNGYNTVVDMSSISIDEVNIYEDAENSSGESIITIAMKDGSGSITIAPDKKQQYLYISDAHKAMNSETPPEATKIAVPDRLKEHNNSYIQFSDKKVSFESKMIEPKYSGYTAPSVTSSFSIKL